MKLFLVGPNNNGDGVYSLVAENGECHYQHLCSHAGYAKGDLIENRPERQKELSEKYGTYEIFWLNEQSYITEEELVKRNKEFNSKENQNKE